MRKEFLFILPFLLIACSDSGSPYVEGEFAIYTLEDPTIDARTALSYPIESLLLKQTPFLTVADLKSYTWSTHSFELKPEMTATWDDFQRHGGSVSGVPFVVTVGSQKVYAGTFWWAYSSVSSPPCPIIEVIAPSPYVIRLDPGLPDRRSDRRIHKALKLAGVLVE